MASEVSVVLNWAMEEALVWEAMVGDTPSPQEELDLAAEELAFPAAELAFPAEELAFPAEELAFPAEDLA
jgi:hypothetical protein